MDIFVDEDDILWECQCQMLRTGNLCAWQVIGGVDPVHATRKRVPKHRRLRIVAYTIPSVVCQNDQPVVILNPTLCQPWKTYRLELDAESGTGWIREEAPDAV